MVEDFHHASFYDPIRPVMFTLAPEEKLRYLTVKMEAGAIWEMPAEEKEVNRKLYFYDGDTLAIDDQEIQNYHAIEVDPASSLTLKAGAEDCYILVLQGKPINEPVAQYGPFVMNTQEEIQQTMKDYGRTQFGGWPWPRPDQVHDRERGRFALYADGTEEIK